MINKKGIYSKDIKFFKKRLTFFLILFVIIFQLTPITIFAADLTSINPSEDPTKPSFKIIVCDGPALPDNPAARTALLNGKSESEYKACDFNGVVYQVQHLLNIMMILGTLVAIVLFTWAGILYMTGKQANISKAKSIFPKIFFGFIIMLLAWFIVYQILVWVAPGPSGREGVSPYTILLGNP